MLFIEFVWYRTVLVAYWKNKINWWNLKQTHKRAERRIDKVNRIRNITMTIQSRYQWGKRVILRSFGWHYPFDTSFVVNFQLQAPNSIKTNAFNACLHISSMCICSICFIFFLSEYFNKKKKSTINPSDLSENVFFSDLVAYVLLRQWA